MPNARDVLATEVALLAAETDYIAELIERGILPEGARREPTTRELRAGVRFAELDRIVTQAGALIARTVGPVRDVLLAELGPMLERIVTGADASPYDVAEALTALDTTQIPGLPAALDEAIEEIVGQLETVARAGAHEALGEALRQGVPETMLPRLPEATTAEVRAAAAAHASRVATTTVTRLLEAATEGATRAATVGGATTTDVITAAVQAATDASVAAIEDQARQAANVTHGIGRRDAQTALPEPAEVYASELLDRNTCGPCADLDGTEYDTLEDGLMDYPGAGGYIGCEGGSRCRGTLVVVWPREAGATVDNTPPANRGPSGATRPGHIGPDGGILPA